MLTILQGDVRDMLATIPDESVHCCITSPPYWGLRDYGVDGQLGLEKTPEEYLEKMVEVFREVKRVMRRDGTLWLNEGDCYAGGGRGNYGDGLSLGQGPKHTNGGNFYYCSLKPKDLCMMPARLALALQADGWWLRSDIIWSKLNPMPESVSGSAWERHRVNVGKQPLEMAGYEGQKSVETGKRAHPYGGVINAEGAQYSDCPGCPKCSPNDGYVLHMSAGRPTTSHEHIFLLTKSASYFYDAEAVRERQETANRSKFYDPADRPYREETAEKISKFASSRERNEKGIFISQGKDSLNPKDGYQGQQRKDRLPRLLNPAGRNLRSVWTFATQPFPEAHFATYPEELVKRCILAGAPAQVCPKCGAPWVRVVETSRHFESGSGRSGNPIHGKQPPVQGAGYGDIRMGPVVELTTLGFRPSCKCGLDPIPSTVLDPFAGSFTTGAVALKMGRKAIMIELKEEYCEMGRKRCKVNLGLGI